MRVVVTGKNKHFPRDEIRAYVHWLGVKLLGDIKNLTVRLIQKPNLGDTSVLEVLGRCYCKTSDDGLREITVYLKNKSSKLMQQRSLAHEMVHGKQLFNKELSADLTCWKKRRILKDSKEIDTISHHAYENLPWEREANRKAKILLRCYREEQKKCHSKQV